MERLGQNHADHQGAAVPDRAGPARLHAQARAPRLRPRPAGQGFVHAPAGRRDRGGDQFGEALCGAARVARRTGVGPAGPADQALAGRPGAGRGLQARRLPQGRDPPRGERQAADSSRRSAHHRDRVGYAAATGERACGRSRRHRADRRRAAEARDAAAKRGAGDAESLMAQLTDDCFAFSGPLLPIADMERLIAERVTPVTESETVPLTAARGRVIARAVTAPIDLPPFDNSAVDGYAVRHRDLDAKATTRLAVAGRLTAGSAA